MCICVVFLSLSFVLSFVSLCDENKQFPKNFMCVCVSVQYAEPTTAEVAECGAENSCQKIRHPTPTLKWSPLVRLPAPAITQWFIILTGYVYIKSHCHTVGNETDNAVLCHPIALTLFDW